MQPGLVEAPSTEPQQPVELQNTSAHHVPVQNEALKASYSPAVTDVSAVLGLDARGTSHGSLAMPAELSGEDRPGWIHTSHYKIEVSAFDQIVANQGVGYSKRKGSGLHI